MEELERKVSQKLALIEIGDEVIIKRGEGQPACEYDTTTVVCFKQGSTMITIEGIILSRRTLSDIEKTGNHFVEVTPSDEAKKINQQMTGAGEFNRRSLGL